MNSGIFAIIAGAGPGTGAAIARRFAQSYPVVLLARTTDSYADVVQEINTSGGVAVGITADVSSESSIRAAIAQIEQTFGNEATCAAAIFNASGRFSVKPFMELTSSEFEEPFKISGKGSFLFSQAVLPFLLNSSAKTPKHSPTLIFTGATASIRGSAKVASFAAGKFATRAVAQSLAREFGPRGVHVSHVIIDGIIDLPGSEEFSKNKGPNTRLDVTEIANTYWFLHSQPPSAFTHEIEIRPHAESW